MSTVGGYIKSAYQDLGLYVEDRKYIICFQTTMSIYLINSDLNIVSEGNYVVKVNYSGENRKSEMTLGFDSKTNQVAVFSITPKYSVIENMEKAALNTVLGMGTVFIILIFISFLISLFKYINVFENKLKAKTKEEPVIEAVKVNEPENLEDDLELVAVITAAIAEFSNTDASNLIVRSIKRVKR